MINHVLIPKMGAMLNQQPLDSQQKTFMKSQITSYNQSYNELNDSYEIKIMEHEELVHSGLPLKPTAWIMAF
jgi:hypothetical protein